MTIRDRLNDGTLSLTRADLKVARALLSDYPAAGLNTVAHLAQSAGVSAPTVVRFVGRLGFDGYPDFQRALLSEVQERMFSPLRMLASGKGALAPDNLYSECLGASARSVEVAAGMVPTASFYKAVDLLANPSLSIHCLGGRFSGYLAGMLWAHLNQLRPRCHRIDEARPDRIDRLVDFGPRDLLVVFDYRRYQVDTLEFAELAVSRGARVVLFTDPYASPIARLADVIVSAPVDYISPFDTLVPALAQTEAVIAALTVRLGEGSRQRIEAMEDLRRRASITEDAYGLLRNGDEND